MKEILKPEPPLNWWVGYKGECPVCRREFEFEMGDDVETYRVTGGFGVRTKCPKCKILDVIAYNLWPHK